MKAANEMFTKPAPAVKPGDLAVVVGAGVSGVAAAKLLHKLGARVRLLDRSLDRIPADFAEWAESAGVEIVCGVRVLQPEPSGGQSEQPLSTEIIPSAWGELMET